MKKPIALVALLCTLCMGAHADLILHEDFDRTVGTLNQGLVYDMGANTNDWWHNTGGADSIKVVAGSLKYTDYVESNGNRAMILGGAVSTDLRQFAPISSGKVYAAAIINIDSVASATSAGAFFSLGDASTGTYAKLHCYQSGEGFKLAVTKSTEGSNEIEYTSDVYNTKTDYFVVVEYQFVDGDKNDSVRLYVNPVKDNQTASIECAYSKQIRQGARVVSGGANTKADATQIASVDLSQSSNTAVGRIYVDEIKVATSWNDLFPAEPSTLILHETFDYSAGQLSVGRYVDCNDSTKWWSLKSWTAGTTTPTNPIMIVDNSLSYPGYVTSATGNKAQLKTIAGTADVRRFAPVTSGSVYAAAIINMTSATTSVEHFFGLCLGTSDYFSKVYAKSADDGFQLAIAKGSETKSNLTSYSSTLSFNKNYLIVVEYVFKEGAKNDSVNLWINPTKSTTTPTLVCDTTLANAKGDASKIAGVYLYQSNNAPTVAIDEIKVATAWDDLFESSTPTPEPTVTPEILVDNTITFSKGNIYTGTEYSANFYLYAENLTDSVKLTCNNADVTLSKTALSKEEAEAGIDITATLNPTTAGYREVTITVSSKGAEDVTVTSSWTAIVLNKVSTIAALKEGTAADEAGLFLYTGEAIITYSEPENYYTKYYLEDASGAVRIDDWFGSNTYEVGDKVKDIYAIYGEGEDINGQIPLTLYSNVITVVSSGNEPTPQVVTLEQLQANAADYLLELVKVEEVSLDQTSTTFSTDSCTITQNGTAGAIELTSDNTLVGTAKPKKANIIGLSYNKSGYNVRIRTAADLTPIDDTTPTAIEAITLDQLTGEYEIYTIAGQRVNTLQPGVNIIRQGEKAYKVIR